MRRSRTGRTLRRRQRTFAVVDGTASLERDGELDQATAGMPLVEGDRLTTANGRLEILLPDGSALDVDEDSAVDVQSSSVMRLTRGRLVLLAARATDSATSIQFQIDTPIASATVYSAGEYRVSLMSSPDGVEAELAVIRGSAALTTDRGSMPLRTGQRSFARDNEPPSYAQTFNSARFDVFDRWVDARRDARLRSAASTQYLPSDLRAYGGTFDQNGAWQYEAPYGYVWYPSVAPGWRPYYNGYWTSLPSYGWTWVGFDAWSWPTHHYGRWGYSRAHWFWIPAARWSPAWVTWASGPGLVSWCPLGFDNRPVFALSIGTGNPWAGWVVFPRDRFGARGAYVSRFAVSGQQLSARTPFIEHGSAPIAAGRAVPRASTQTAVRSRPEGDARPQGAFRPGAQVENPRARADQQARPFNRPADRAATIDRAVPRADRRLPTIDSRPEAPQGREPMTAPFRGYQRAPNPGETSPAYAPQAVPRAPQNQAGVPAWGRAMPRIDGRAPVTAPADQVRPLPYRGSPRPSPAAPQPAPSFAPSIARPAPSFAPPPSFSQPAPSFGRPYGRPSGGEQPGPVAVPRSAPPQREQAQPSSPSAGSASGRQASGSAGGRPAGGNAGAVRHR